jgi:hypothetical protein
MPIEVAYNSPWLPMGLALTSISNFQRTNSTMILLASPIILCSDKLDHSLTISLIANDFANDKTGSVNHRKPEESHKPRQTIGGNRHGQKYASIP